MDFPTWYRHTPHVALREQVRVLEPAYSLLVRWADRPQQWRAELTHRLRDLFGLAWEEETVPGPPLSTRPVACPLDVRELEQVDEDGFSRTRLAYNVEVGLTASAWVCVPHDNEHPLPAVICVPSREAQADALLGLTGEPDLPGYRYAVELAQCGYVVLVPDLRGYGEARDDEDGLAATGELLGRPLMGMHVWDLSRAVDYLQTRPEVRSDRIGITGLRLGAQAALLAAALEERLNCAAISGGLSTLRELVVARDCFTGETPPPELVPGLLRYADLDDVACLVAPRPLIMVQSNSDSSVPESGVRELFERTKAGFELLGEGVKLETMQVEGSEADCVGRLLRFLDDWLKLP